MVVKLEAFDLSEKGFDTPFFRRQMAMLLKLQTKGDLQADGILATFTKSQIEDIYPPLSAILAQMLLEELDPDGYVAIQDGTGLPLPPRATTN